jgi:hypothetical protein
MINVNEIKIFIDFLTNKEQSGTSYSIIQLNNAFQAANIDLFKLRYGLPEEYTPAMPLPRMAYEVTQKMKDDLRACKEVSDIPVDQVGEMILPDNYVHVTAVTYIKYTNQCCDNPPKISRREVERIDDDKWSERLSNSIKTPSKDYPVCNFLKDRIRIEPRDLGKVEFSYLRTPSKPVWAYTVVGGVEKYDAGSSTNFDWNEILFTDIAKLIIGYLAINLRDGELASAIEQYKTKGV